MSTREENIRQNEMLTVKEVAAYLRVSRVTIWRWCQQGIIPASRVGRNWRIRRDDLLYQLQIPELLPPHPNNNNPSLKITNSSSTTNHPSAKDDNSKTNLEDV